MVQVYLQQQKIKTCTSDTGGGIDLPLKDQWDLVQCNIADDPTKTSRDGSQYNADAGMQPPGQAFLNAQNGEKAKSQCIKNKKGLFKVADDVMKNNRYCRSNGNDNGIIQV